MDKDKLKKLWKTLYPTLLLVVFHIIFSQAAYYLSYPDEKEILLGYNGARHITVSAVIFCTFYYSFVRIQTIYNKTLRERYIEAEGRISFFPFVLRSWDFWLNIVGFLAVVLPFGLNKTYSFLYELFCESESDMIGKLTATAIAFAVLVIINLLARYNGMKIWNRSIGTDARTASASRKRNHASYKADKLIPTAPSLAAMRFITRSNSGKNPALENEAPEPPSYDKGGTVKSYTIVFAMYTFCVFAANIIYTVASFVLVPFFMISYARNTAIIIAAIIVSIPIIRRIRSIIKRLKLVQRLKKICKENKFKLSIIKSPFTSLFSAKSGESFNVTANGKTYSCKLLSCIKPSLPFVLNEDGSGYVIHAFTFAGIKWFRRIKPFAFGYESKHQKILIINPSSKFICVDNDGTVTELDNGDRVGDYIIYTASSFINSLDRNVLGTVNEKKNFRGFD